MGTIKTTNIEPIADNGTVTLGSSGDTFTIGSGVKQSNMLYPAFEAILGSNQSITSNANTKVTCDTEIFDTDNCYDNSTNYRFTPNVAGKYVVYCAGRGDAGGSNLQNMWVRLEMNSTGNALTYQYCNFAPNNLDNFTLNALGTLSFNGSSDYVEFFCRISDSSGNPSIIGDSSERRTFFGAYRIGS